MVGLFVPANGRVLNKVLLAAMVPPPPEDEGVSAPGKNANSPLVIKTTAEDET